MKQTKAFRGLKITDAAEGKVKAVFATLNVKDSDGDVTLAGAFTKEEVRISAYNHQSWKAALPVGKGVIFEDGEDVVFEGEFFLDTTAGKETFAVVKRMGDLQEWSYGYDPLDSERGTKDGEAVRFLKSLKVHEVSPVILGAGVNTRTLVAKAFKQMQSDLRQRLCAAATERFGGEKIYVWVIDFDVDDEFAIVEVEDADSRRYLQVPYTRDGDDVTLGEEETEVERTTTYTPKGAQDLQFKAHIDAVLAAVDAVADRAADVVAKRAEKGKGLGSESADSLAELTARVERLKGVMTAPAAPKDDTTAAVEREFLRFVRHTTT